METPVIEVKLFSPPGLLGLHELSINNCFICCGYKNYLERIAASLRRNITEAKTVIEIRRNLIPADNAVLYVNQKAILIDKSSAVFRYARDMSRALPDSCVVIDSLESFL
jgi:hypothetical protein